MSINNIIISDNSLYIYYKGGEPPQPTEYVNLYKCTYKSVSPGVVPKGPWTFTYFEPSECGQSSLLKSRMPLRCGYTSPSFYDIGKYTSFTELKQFFHSPSTEPVPGNPLNVDHTLFKEKAILIYNNLFSDADKNTIPQYYNIDQDKLKNSGLFKEITPSFQFSSNTSGLIFGGGHLIYDLSKLNKVLNNNILNASGICSLLEISTNNGTTFYILQMCFECVIDATGTSHEMGYSSMYALLENLPEIGIDVNVNEKGGLGGYNLGSKKCETVDNDNRNIKEIKVLPLTWN